jgi:D-alanyl-D-alanine carboxypeptidase
MIDEDAMPGTQRWWSFALNGGILLLFLLGSYFVVTRADGSGSNGVAQPTLEPLPTFSLSEAARVNVESAAAGGASAFTCPLSIDIGPVQLAECTDCMFFPVDRLHALPSTYVPPVVESRLLGGGRLRQEASVALTALFDAAKQQGHVPRITSAYRSFTEQYDTFQTWVSFERQKNLSEAQAIARAGRYSARPGHSEHQLGTVVDVNCASCVPFDRNNGQNLALWAFFERTAHEYGFVISYPRGIEALTGYEYEPWHLRYIGVEYAAMLHAAGYLESNGVCLINFLRRQSNSS